MEEDARCQHLASTCIHTYTHVHVQTPTYEHMYITYVYLTHMNMNTHIHLYTYACIPTFEHMHTCLHATYMNTHLTCNTHTYIYAYTNAFIPLHVNTYATQMCACVFLDAKIHIHKLAYHTYVHAHPYMWTHIQTCIWIYLYMPHVNTHVYVHSHMWVYIYACIPHTHTWEKKNLWFLRCFLLSQIWA